MPLNEYSSSFSPARPQIKEIVKKDYKSLLERKALAAIDIDPNVNLDPDFLMTTSLTQIKGEYTKRIGHSSAPACSIPTELTLSKTVVEERDAKNVRGPQLNGKPNYDLIFRKK